MTYSLPDLPYDHGALEPHCSARVLELHHGKHHAAYVAGAKTTLESWPPPSTNTSDRSTDSATS